MPYLDENDPLFPCYHGNKNSPAVHWGKFLYLQIIYTSYLQQKQQNHTKNEIIPIEISPSLLTCGLR